MKIVALIVAAGSGLRLQSSVPKQYIEIGEKTILRHAIEVFLGANIAVEVVINKEHRALYDEATLGLELPEPIIGGQTRQESVRNGLNALKDKGFNRVLIHDAARPFLTSRLINDIVESAGENKVVLPTVPVVDSLKIVKNEVVSQSVDRANMAFAQTPQAFDFATILELHDKFKAQNFTDDAALAEAGNVSITAIKGDVNNFKITTEDDLKRARMMVSNSYETRVGSGFDVHSFDDDADDKFVTICGVKIAHDKPLKGHSDADVALHAAIDALLGAISEGDIGQHFPPSNEKWKNADSEIFCKYVLTLLKKHRSKIINLDITIICEAPKIATHREELRKNVARIFEIDINRVSVKATTTEKLGFLGREQGIAATANASVAYPCS